jgi:hypothetical protein
MVSSPASTVTPGFSVRVKPSDAIPQFAFPFAVRVNITLPLETSSALDTYTQFRKRIVEGSGSWCSDQTSALVAVLLKA